MTPDTPIEVEDVTKRLAEVARKARMYMESKNKGIADGAIGTAALAEEAVALINSQAERLDKMQNTIDFLDDQIGIGNATVKRQADEIARLRKQTYKDFEIEVTRVRSECDEFRANVRAENAGLRSELSAVREQLRWRDVRDELPDTDVPTIATWRPYATHVGAFYDAVAGFWYAEANSEVIDRPTHWIPFPPLPAIETKP